MTGVGRVAARVAPDLRSGALATLHCQTDFLANGEEFKALLEELAWLVLKHGPVDDAALRALPLRGGDRGTVGAALDAFARSSGETIALGKFARIDLTR